jgi:hypothetical protein
MGTWLKGTTTLASRILPGLLALTALILRIPNDSKGDAILRERANNACTSAAIPAPAMGPVHVSTHLNDNARTGLNPEESVLTPFDV